MHAEGSDVPIATAVSGADGTATMLISAPAGTYLVEGKWPGVQGDNDDGRVLVEFTHNEEGANAPIELEFPWTYGILTGTVTTSGVALPSSGLAGASLAISSGGIEVQRLRLSADGSFTSGALPTTSDPTYRVTLLPPIGAQLAAEQPDALPAFALPKQDTPVTCNPSFRLERDASRSPIVPIVVPDPSQPFSGSGGDGGLQRPLHHATEAQLQELLERMRNSAPHAVQGGDYGRVDGIVYPERTELPDVELPRDFDVDTDAFIGLDTSALIDRLFGKDVLSDKTMRLLDELVENAIQSAALEYLDRYWRDPSAVDEDRLIAALERAGIGPTELDELRNAPTPDHVQDIAERLRGAIAAPSSRDEIVRAAAESDRRELLDALLRSAAGENVHATATMFSSPTPLGRVTLSNGVITAGAFDFDRVPPGRHHLVLSIEELGITYIVGVTVPAPEELADSGAAPGVVPIWGFALTVLGAAVVLCSRVTRRRA